MSASKIITPTPYQSLAGVAGFARCLLGRHVRGRAAGAVVRRAGASHAIADEAEVEHDHAPFARDEDVARVQVPVELAQVVQRRDRGRELPERGAEPALVEA